MREREIIEEGKRRLKLRDELLEKQTRMKGGQKSGEKNVRTASE